ncbi:hypothetical protein Tco_1166888 [Tanacetum coccineum]
MPCVLCDRIRSSSILFEDLYDSFISLMCSFTSSIRAIRIVSSSVSAGYIIEFMLEDLEAVPADYVPAGHVVVVVSDGVPSIVKLLFVIIDSSGTGSLPSGRVDLTGDEDPTDEDGDIGMGDSTGVLVSLGGGISSGGKKSRESNDWCYDKHWRWGQYERVSEAIRTEPNELFEDSEEVFPGEAGK